MNEFWKLYFKKKGQEIVAVVQWIGAVLLIILCAVACAVAIYGILKAFVWNWKVSTVTTVAAGLIAWHVLNVRDVKWDLRRKVLHENKLPPLKEIPIKPEHIKELTDLENVMQVNREKGGGGEKFWQAHSAFWARARELYPDLPQSVAYDRDKKVFKFSGEMNGKEE